jgi:negative regulator of genetic competence, sporulation and motility
MVDDAEREKLLKQLEELKAEGEKNYDNLYETHSDYDATVCYSGAKEAFHDAIALARRLGLDDEAETLYKRLKHIKAVFRSQFS